MNLRLAGNPHHLVLVPGLDGTGRLFEPFLSVLPAGTDTSIVSFPHDKCLYDRDLFACLRNVIPWNRGFIVVGESTSGPLAMRFAAAQHENVRAVILVSSFVSDPIAASSNWATTFLSKPWYEKPATPASVRKHLLGRNATDGLVNQAVHALRTPWPEVLGHRIEQMRKVDARDALRDWRKPLLYLRGTDDAFINQSSVTEVKDLNPSAILVSVPGPHLLLQANPRGAAEAINLFLQELAEQDRQSAA